jgi:hypothetical protein
VYSGHSNAWHDLVANVPPSASFASEIEEMAVVMDEMSVAAGTLTPPRAARKTGRESHTGSASVAKLGIE